MKNILQVLSVVLIFTAVSGCSKWNQDPMAGQSDLLKNPQNSPQGPEKPQPPEPNDSVRVDTVDFFSFREGETGEFEISARVLRADYTFEIVLDNIDEFPGAVFDAKTGKFTWNVVTGTLPPGSQDRVNKSLHVVAYAIDPGGNRKFYAEKSVLIAIDKFVGVPTIISISRAATYVREGERKSVTVKIKDMDASDDQSTWPTVVVSQLPGYGNLAAFVKLNRVTNVDPHIFEVLLNVDLTDAELTSNYMESGFVVMALSHLGKSSSSSEVRMSVATSFSDVKTTWWQALEVSASRSTTYQFTIYDPKGETKVGTPTFSSTPAEAAVTCSYSSSDQAQYCSMTFTPNSSTRAGDTLYIRGNVVTSSTSFSDVYTRTHALTFTLKVTGSGPSPVPGPTPTPSPTPWFHKGAE
jgi:hypothetical protein